MSDDTKTDFYLRNRALIEEWAALRTPAATALDEALLSRCRGLVNAGDWNRVEVKEDAWRTAKVFITDDPLPAVRINLTWERATLLRPHGWPYLGLEVNPTWTATRDALRVVAMSQLATLGLTSKGKKNEWNMQSGRLDPVDEPIEIDAYADYCIERVRDAWAGLHELVVEVVARTGERQA